ncbi:hypothetical protein M231_01750 [Tremella mesenterica]|uniref:Uncharacterized protein n=1 Tax=Tremella mesenterica TaxID=5217 RepID=A0A4Q1BSN1_TREME|nr:hypothetical protein M231_01750 [Tremella mesenterica]
MTTVASTFNMSRVDAPSVRTIGLDSTSATTTNSVVTETSPVSQNNGTMSQQSFKELLSQFATQVGTGEPRVDPPHGPPGPKSFGPEIFDQSSSASRNTIRV